MAAGLSASAQFANTFPRLILETKLTLSQIGAMKQAVTTIPLEPGNGLQIHIPTWTQPTAYTLTEGIDMAQAQQISDADFSVTVAENAGVQVILTRLAMRAMKGDTMQMAARSMANALEKKRDQDLLSLNSGFSAGLGSAGTVMGIGHLMAGKVRLQNNTRPIEGAIQGVFHPYQLHGLYEDLLTVSSGALGSIGLSAGSMQEELIRNYEMFNLAGIAMTSDPNITVDGSDDAVGAMFAKMALIYVPFEDEDLEDEYDSSMRATELNLVATYGYGEYADTWGRTMTFDAATPSS